MESVEELQKDILRLGELVGVKTSYLLIGDETSDVVTNVEIHGEEYLCVVVERGIERKRVVTKSSSYLKYLFLQSATHAAASSFAANNKMPGQNFRRLLFKHQLKLLRKLKPEWADRRQKEIDEILKEHPYAN